MQKVMEQKLTIMTLRASQNHICTILSIQHGTCMAKYCTDAHQWCNQAVGSSKFLTYNQNRIQGCKYSNRFPSFISLRETAPWRLLPVRSW